MPICQVASAQLNVLKIIPDFILNRSYFMRCLKFTLLGHRNEETGPYVVTIEPLQYMTISQFALAVKQYIDRLTNFKEAEII